MFMFTWSMACVLRPQILSINLFRLALGCCGGNHQNKPFFYASPPFPTRHSWSPFITSFIKAPSFIPPFITPLMITTVTSDSPLLSSLPSPLLSSLLSPLLHHCCHHCCHHCHSQEHQLHRHCFNIWFNGLLSLASVEDEATPPVYVFGVDLDSGEEIVLFLHATYISDGLKQNKRKSGFKLEVQRTSSQPYMWHLLH